jgi:hypothetical protein
MQKAIVRLMGLHFRPNTQQLLIMDELVQTVTD